MDNLNSDLILYILTFLSDKNKLTLFSLSKYFDSLIIYCIFDDFHNYNKILQQRYFDNFSSINNYRTGILPKKINRICFSYNFNQEIICLPDSITYIKFDKGFYQNLKGKLPNNLLVLKLNGQYNQCLQYCLPINLKTLKITNRNITNYVLLFGSLPTSLTELNVKLFEEHFNIEKILPKNLIKLKISYFFVCQINNIKFPNNLISLDYNKPIKFFLPKNLIILTLHYYNFAHFESKYLPLSLKKIIVVIKKILVDVFESRLINFVNNIPNYVQTIEFNFHKNCYDLSLIEKKNFKLSSQIKLDRKNKNIFTYVKQN